jgi:hypothetical protein
MSYYDIVLSFNINRSNSFIIDRQMLKIFRKNIKIWNVLMAILIFFLIDDN